MGTPITEAQIMTWLVSAVGVLFFLLISMIGFLWNGLNGKLDKLIETVREDMRLLHDRCNENEAKIETVSERVTRVEVKCDIQHQGGGFRQVM